MKIIIKNRWSEKVIVEAEAESLKQVVIDQKANLYEANLSGANLRGADLYEADLRGADLYEADLCGADLCEADLRGADLCDADLSGADLYEAKIKVTQKEEILKALHIIIES